MSSFTNKSMITAGIQRGDTNSSYCRISDGFMLRLGFNKWLCPSVSTSQTPPPSKNSYGDTLLIKKICLCCVAGLNENMLVIE